MRMKLVLTLIAAVLATGAAEAGQTDYHDLFEKRCLACHGHAGDFARETLRVEPDGVVGSRGQPLEQFLSRHQGGLAKEDIGPILEMFRRQIESGALFRERCAICHDTAREFARINLILRDGVLIGRYSDREVAPFLVGHARLTASQAAEMTQALTAILGGAR